MVEFTAKQLTYNLNHIYRVYVYQGEIAVGASEDDSETDFQLELYERSIALAGDLKKLPVLRGLSGSWSLNGAIISRMGAAGSSINGINCEIIVYDANDNDEDWELIRYSLFVYQESGSHVVEKEPIVWDYEGGYVLNNTITIRIITSASNNAATNAFPEKTIEAYVFFEVDWVPATKQQVTDYINEFIFARDR